MKIVKMASGEDPGQDGGSEPSEIQSFVLSLFEVSDTWLERGHILVRGRFKEKGPVSSLLWGGASVA